MQFDMLDLERSLRRVEQFLHFKVYIQDGAVIQTYEVIRETDKELYNAYRTHEKKKEFLLLMMMSETSLGKGGGKLSPPCD